MIEMIAAIFIILLTIQAILYVYLSWKDINEIRAIQNLSSEQPSGENKSHYNQSHPSYSPSKVNTIERSDTSHYPKFAKWQKPLSEPKPAAKRQKLAKAEKAG